MYTRHVLMMVVSVTTVMVMGVEGIMVVVGGMGIVRGM